MEEGREGAQHNINVQIVDRGRRGRASSVFSCFCQHEKADKGRERESERERQREERERARARARAKQRDR